MNTPTSIKELLERYFRGHCTREEEQWVRQYLADSEHDQDVDQFMREKWESLPGGQDAESGIHTALRYAGIKKRIQVKQFIPGYFYYAAASVLLLFAMGSAYLFRIELLDLVDPVETISYTTRAGQQMAITLPDGSKVWLNTSSTLRFPDAFRHGSREIELTGEAFFDVQHDPKKTFLVHSGNFYTRVLGTSFNIEAYPNGSNQIRVTVATGKVAIGVKDSAGKKHQELARLAPNQQAWYNIATQALVRDSVIAAEQTAWREGRLVFRRASLEDMVATLERWYGVSIQIEAPADRQCSFTAEYYAGISLRDILEALRITGKIDYEIGDKNVVIRTRSSCR